VRYPYFMLAFLGGNEVLVVLVVVLLLFGSSQVPKLAKNLGKAQKEFKDGLDEAKSSDDEQSSTEP
jgi:sec-independent protein translocase protein TatA